VDVSIQNLEKQKITVNVIGGVFQDIATLKPVLNVPFPRDWDKEVNGS